MSCSLHYILQSLIHPLLSPPPSHIPIRVPVPVVVDPRCRGASTGASATESGQPRLMLAVDTPSSASPFPSPSSTFFPPPIPSSHEFANRIVNNKRYRAKSVGNKDKEKEKPRDQKISLTTGDAPSLSDGSSKPSPLSRSAGASPSNVTNPLPALTPTWNTSTTTSPAPKLAGSGPSASRPPAAPSIASLSGRVSQSIPPVVTVVDTTSNSLVPPAPCDPSVPTSATVVPSAVTNDTVQRTTPLYPITHPAGDTNTRIPASPSIVVPLPQPHDPQSQSPNSYGALLKLHAQESSTDTGTPVSAHAPKPTFSGDQPDLDYDGTSTPVVRQRPESTASLSMALVGVVSLSRASSLSSSRPAPPSPAPSRRASQQLLRRNSSLRRSTSSLASVTGGKGGGGANLGRSASTRSTTNKQGSTFSMTSLAPPIDTTISGLQATALSPTVEQPSPAVEYHLPQPIIVRDFAYAPEDYWFSARPVELLPRSERESKRGSSTSRSSRGFGGWYVYLCSFCIVKRLCVHGIIDD